MDAHALLSAQGWRGTGHSLHKTDDTIGLAKPLLLNRKDNTKGLGQKQHFTSDQWWMDAFDEQLKGLDTSKDGKVVQTITTGKLNSIEQGSLGKWALYTSFVKGGFLEGTLMSKSDEEMSEDSGEDDDGGEDKNSMVNLAKNKVELATGEKETKEERKARRDERRRLKAERSAQKEKKSKKSKEPESTKEDTTNSSKVLRKAEKLARRARKEEKRRKRSAKESKATKG